MSYGYEGKLIKEIEEISEPKVLNYLLFEENEATIEYVCNGHVLKEGNTFNDIYGEMTCKENAIKDAKEIAKDLELKKDSDLVIQVKVKTYRIKRKKTGISFKTYESVGYPETTNEEIVWLSSQNVKEVKK